jgi:hypothetical protein
MTTSSELRTGLLAVAKRSMGIVKGCSNLEATRLYLALPFLGLLGYDYSNPYEVFPEHRAPVVEGLAPKVDFAVLRDGKPIIAMECRAAGSDSLGDRTNLANYFRSVQTAKLAIQTNGILYSFFVDSDSPDVMDDEPFLTLDLETVESVGVADDVLESLLLLTKEHIDTNTLAEAAHVQLVKKRLRSAFVEEAAAPSSAFCRFALDRIGLKNVRPESIDRYYAPMVKAAFEESLVMPVVQRLRVDSGTGESRHTPALLHKLGPRVAISERESSILGYVRRRLAYLVEDERMFSAIENVHAKDYVGRVVVYYERERKGRMFDFISGGDKTDKYVFPEPIGEIRTRSIADIDQALKAIFLANVSEQPSNGASAMFPTLRRADGYLG